MKASYSEQGQGKGPSGAEIVAMVATLEGFIIALAASESKTRPDADAFIASLRDMAIDAVKRFSHPQASSTAEQYANDLVEAIKAEAGK